MNPIKLFLVVLVLVCTFGAARAETLTAQQKAYIDRYLAENDLNIYGDPEGTMYMGGSPLFDESTGQVMDRYQFVIRRHPHLLDSFVEARPVDETVTARRILNDFDASRVAGRVLSVTAVRRSEESIQALVQAMSVAVEARDFAALSALFKRIGQLSDVKPFATVFKAARRMLQMPCIQPIEYTEQISALLATLDQLEARLR